MLYASAEIERANALNNPVDLNRLTREQFYKDFKEQAKVYKISHLFSLATTLGFYALFRLTDTHVSPAYIAVLYGVPQLFLSYLTSGWCGKEFHNLKDKARRADELFKGDVQTKR